MTVKLTVLQIPSRQTTVQEVGASGSLFPGASIFLYHKEPTSVVLTAAIVILNEESSFQRPIPTRINHMSNHSNSFCDLSLVALFFHHLFTFFINYCKRFIFCVHTIRRTLNFSPFNEDMILHIIQKFTYSHI